MKHYKLSWSQIIVAAFLGTILGIVITNRKNQTMIVFEEKNNTSAEPAQNDIESEKRKRGFEKSGYACILFGTLVAFASWLLRNQSFIQSSECEYFVYILAVAIVSFGGNLLAQSFAYRKIK
jgi:hypothetical protein